MNQMFKVSPIEVAIKLAKDHALERTACCWRVQAGLIASLQRVD